VPNVMAHQDIANFRCHVGDIWGKQHPDGSGELVAVVR
jgi:hypothetical protein